MNPSHGCPRIAGHREMAIQGERDDTREPLTEVGYLHSFKSPFI